MTDDTKAGAWVTYYADWSGIAIFATELEALRYAVGRTMEVKFVEFGGEIR
jgi:hypothetical protein